MSLSTPILALTCWALAAPQASMTASTVNPKVFRMSSFLLVVLGSFGQ
jgi:hypothetical protein